MKESRKESEPRVAIVTGASRGIGQAIALELSQRGIATAVNYSKAEEEADATVQQIRQAGGNAIAVQADVANEASVRAMVASVVRQFGRLDILVCNAGIVRESLVGSMPTDAWESVLAANLNGAFFCIRESIPHLMRERNGCIVNVSSVQSARGGRGQGNYAASKAGLEALTRVLAIELGPKGVRVNAVAPGVIETDLTRSIRDHLQDQLVKEIPLRRFGQPADVANAVAFLTSSAAAYVTGATIPLTGGYGL